MANLVFNNHTFVSRTLTTAQGTVVRPLPHLQKSLVETDYWSKSK